jgi:hypothetical protein
MFQKLPVVFRNGNGGCLIGLVYDEECQNWTDEHFNDDLLVDIRKRGIGGPLPSVMGVNKPALVLFGSSTAKEVLQCAEALANYSKYPVIIKSPTENPALDGDYTYVCVNFMKVFITPWQQYVRATNTHQLSERMDDSSHQKKGGGSANNQSNMSGGRNENEGTSKGSRDTGEGGEDAPDDSVGGSGNHEGEGGNGGGGGGTGSGAVDEHGFANPHITMVTVEFNMGKPPFQTLQKLRLERHVKVCYCVCFDASLTLSIVQAFDAWHKSRNGISGARPRG